MKGIHYKTGTLTAALVFSGGTLRAESEGEVLPMFAPQLNVQHSSDAAPAVFDNEDPVVAGGGTSHTKTADASPKPAKSAVWKNPELDKSKKAKGEPAQTTPRINPAAKKVTARSLLDLQTFRETRSLPFEFAPDQVGEVKLTNLNPAINAWFLLEVKWPGKSSWQTYHLENAFPKSQSIALDETFIWGLTFKSGRGQYQCELWSEKSKSKLGGGDSVKPYTELCDSRIYLRNKIEGYRTTKEWVVEFLRDNLWGGEEITSIVKKTVFKDQYLIHGDIAAAKRAKELAASIVERAPLPAIINPEMSGNLLEAKGLGLKLKQSGEEAGKMVVGRWYESGGTENVYVSVVQAGLLAKDILESHRDIVKPLDAVEASAQVYLVAFDMERFELGFAMGTEHPRVGWSERARDTEKKSGAPGPDGFAELDPIVTTGLLNPIDSKRVVATFTGGFKRSHGAFRWGELARKNNGSHYGFMENGVVMSRMQPDLATIIMDLDGRVSMKTWKEEDNSGLRGIRHARQNGVPLIDIDPETGLPKPGKYVSNWMHGNWSGSEDMKFRTLRAGICLQKTKDTTFLIYGYFSSVTPSAMARVFQAYRCQYAMHLDMNALEHTYLATYVEKEDKNYYPQHLIKGMEVLDQRFKGNVPRFIGYPDNRDFFYVMRRFREDPVK